MRFLLPLKQLSIQLGNYWMMPLSPAFLKILFFFGGRIPKLVVDQENADFELDENQETISLDVSSCPICLTFIKVFFFDLFKFLFQICIIPRIFSKIGNFFIVDANLEEEACMDSRITFALNKDGKICGIEKGGNGGISPSSLTQVFQVQSVNIRNPVLFLKFFFFLECHSTWPFDCYST